MRDLFGGSVLAKIIDIERRHAASARFPMQLADDRTGVAADEINSLGDADAK